VRSGLAPSSANGQSVWLVPGQWLMGIQAWAVYPLLHRAIPRTQSRDVMGRIIGLKMLCRAASSVEQAERDLVNREGAGDSVVEFLRRDTLQLDYDAARGSRHSEDDFNRVARSRT